MKKGVIKWYSWEKGYGFIETNENEREYFFHKSKLQQHNLYMLMELKGLPCTFETQANDRGTEAVNVEVKVSQVKSDKNVMTI